MSPKIPGWMLAQKGILEHGHGTIMMHKAGWFPGLGTLAALLPERDFGLTQALNSNGPFIGCEEWPRHEHALPCVLICDDTSSFVLLELIVSKSSQTNKRPAGSAPFSVLFEIARV